jgi:hypothetical protein
MRLSFARLAVALAAVMVVVVVPAARAADTSSFCATCEIQFGVGATYHFWGTTHSLVIPMTVNFDEDRYEFGAFRFTGQQRFFDSTFNAHVLFAEPLWGFSLSRRVELFPHPHWRLLVGFGGSYKTREDRLSSSLWNFAEQVGVRLTPAPSMAIELVGRHFSNAGLKLPNHGEDFATLTFSIYPSLIGHRVASSQ